MLYHILEDTCDLVTEKLKDANEKARTVGSLSVADVDYLDKLTHTVKSVKSTMAMLDAGKSWDDHRSERSCYDGDSQKRDSMGRFTSRWPGVSESLRKHMEEIPEDMRHEYRDFISRLETR